MTDDQTTAMMRQIAQLTHQLGLLEDAAAIRALHHKYGYYLDACLYEQVVELFAEDSELVFLNGIYRGRAGARRLYCGWLRNLFTGGRDGPVDGLLYDHLIFQDVVDVAPDRLSAQGRFRCLMMGGTHDTKAEPIEGLPRQFWEAGIYENRYVKQAGVWKIGRFNYNMLWQANYETGWSTSTVHLRPLDKTYPDDPRGPDVLTAITPKAWPQTRIVPFHYPHPVTGTPWPEAV